MSSLPLEPLLDRRSKVRYPIEFDLEYRMVRGRGPAVIGVGHTINISSQGLLFRTKEKLAAGSPIEAILSWPITLNNHVPLKLSIKGAIIRSEPDRAAIQIASYEFRTGKILKKPTEVVVEASSKPAVNGRV